MSCPETEHFVKNWNRIHKQTARALAAAPADQLDWRPREGMFTLRELVRHIPEAESAIVHTVLAGTMQKGDLDLSSASVEEIVRAQFFADDAHGKAANEFRFEPKLDKVLCRHKLKQFVVHNANGLGAESDLTLDPARDLFFQPLEGAAQLMSQTH